MKMLKFNQKNSDADRILKEKMIASINSETTKRQSALTSASMINAVINKDAAQVTKLITEKYATINEIYPTLGSENDGFCLFFVDFQKNKLLNFQKKNRLHSSSFSCKNRSNRDLEVIA